MAKKEEKRWSIKEIKSQQEQLKFLTDEEMNFVNSNNKKHFFGNTVKELQVNIQKLIQQGKQKAEFVIEIKPVIQNLLELQGKYNIEFKEFKKEVSALLDAKITEEQKKLQKQIQELESQKFNKTTKRKKKGNNKEKENKKK
jgi:hypothetical protein